MTDLRSLFNRYRAAILLFLGSLAVFCIFSGARLFHQSLYAHFVYQADAFLHGQLAMRFQPPNNEDWAYFNQQWYCSFPPFPAVLMMPFVALAGVQFNDVLFTVVFAALNVALFYLVLEQLREAGDSDRTQQQNVLIAALLGFGTVNFYISIRGQVWFTAEVIGVTMTCLYILAAHRARHPVLAGLCFGCAVITRAPLLYAAPFFLFELLMPGGRWDGAAVAKRMAEIRGKIVRFAVPVAAVGIPMAIMNAARFGSPTDFGHGHFFNNRVNADIEHWGLFNYHYLERNLHAAFTRLPTWTDKGLGFDFDGMSLFVTTPLFLMLVWPALKPRLHHALWTTVAAVSVPGFFYQNTGWRQFGFRFSLDYTPYLFMLLAIGGHKIGRLFWLLGLLGLAVGVWGAVAFN